MSLKVKFDVQSARSQFPALNQPVDDDGTLPVFFDNPAGTQVPQRVMDAVVDYYKTMNANSGGAFATSQRSDAMMQEARATVADFLNAPHADEIVFGPNMTTLNYGLSRAIASTLNAGDELVVTRMDHDANVAPWLQIAADHDLTLKWVDINTADATLDMDSYEAALSEKTRLVAAVHASNAVGTINPVQQIAHMAHAAGALFVMDAVQSAPHIPIDVQAIDCDFLLCSAYKFYGPHIGIMWGRYDLLQSLPAYKVRPAKDVPPHRWETGTLSFETIHGTAKALDYLASLADETLTLAASSYEGRRLQIKQAMMTVQAYERDLAAHLILGLNEIPGVTIAGIVDPARFDERVPTVAFYMDAHTPQEIAHHLAQHHIYLWSGHYYAIEIMQRLKRSEQGMVRIGLAHYNTIDEIDRLLDALQALA